MSRRLPSLNQLRAFEAAARHESIKLGAEELCVTPAAVGHQIKALEQSLNTALFHRKTRKIILTDAGRALAATVGQALDDLETAAAKARTSDLSGCLRITVAPFFGNRWLLPRLPRFLALHPGMTIKPSLSFDYENLENTDFDAAVRFGAGAWEGLSSTLIFRDQVRPVCAPQLVEGIGLPMAPEDILDLPLACAHHWRDDWVAWAEAAGAGTRKSVNAFTYESRAFMFDAALSGQSVILADPRMTSADEQAGRLIHLNPLTVERPHGIHIVTDSRISDPRIDLFAEWLKHEARSPD
nr:LysR substrate-binding domain-containing protein [uncultured Roseovarius sp.]